MLNARIVQNCLPGLASLFNYFPADGVGCLDAYVSSSTAADLFKLVLKFLPKAPAREHLLQDHPLATPPSYLMILGMLGVCGRTHLNTSDVLVGECLTSSGTCGIIRQQRISIYSSDNVLDTDRDGEIFSRS